MAWYGFASYGLAGLAYAAIALILLVSHPGGKAASWLIAATVVTAFWGLGVALMLLAGALPPPAVGVLDAAHGLVWAMAMVALLAPSGQPEASRSKRWLRLIACGAALWIVAAAFALPADPAAADAFYIGLIVLAVVGFLAVEQVFRNATEGQAPGLRLLCIGVSGIFAVDLFVYSQAALLGGLLPAFWDSRGLANAALAPLILLAVKRQPAWERELFISRQVAFYTASLLGIGAYLLVMALIAYVIRAVGGEWGLWLQLAFLVAAFAVALVVLFSVRIRARFKVFLVKHFYRNKYDYRHEWLRLTELLSGTGDTGSLARSALEGIAHIVSATKGDLWLTRDGVRYEWVHALPPTAGPEPDQDKEAAIPRFLAAHNWVIDSEEYAAEPDRYGNAFGAPNEGRLPPRSLIVPLEYRGYLQGFAILEKPQDMGALNFEDHDILKTAGKQVAWVLAQSLAQEQLTETRQFEAMNKLVTFFMHDIKNVMAQQELVVANAQRFGHRPEFLPDAIVTIRAGVERMRKVLNQLQGTARRLGTGGGRVEVSKVLAEVTARCADREPVPRLELEGPPAWVSIEHDELASLLTHLVRNAQDATPKDGRVTLRMRPCDGGLEVLVEDTGCGMDPAFLRDRLFRPFDSTKGVQGMGIGAYQAREIVRAAGGEVAVTSELGVGTTFSVRLPVVEVGETRYGGSAA